MQLDIIFTAGFWLDTVSLCLVDDDKNNQLKFIPLTLYRYLYHITQIQKHNETSPMVFSFNVSEWQIIKDDDQKSYLVKVINIDAYDQDDENNFISWLWSPYVNLHTMSFYLCNSLDNVSSLLHYSTYIGPWWWCWAHHYLITFCCFPSNFFSRYFKHVITRHISWWML